MAEAAASGHPNAPARALGAARLPLRHAVQDEIRRRIIVHEYEPGERLFEDQLATELEVSRNPVREALQALATEGFVELEPRRGVRVAEMPPERARELFEVREALEGLVARLAARRRTDAELAELTGLVQRGMRHAAAGELNELPPLNTRFHSLLAQVARNTMLADETARLQHLIEWIYSQRIMLRAPRSWDEHERILAAIALGDEESAERLARTHIAMARAAYVDAD